MSVGDVFLLILFGILPALCTVGFFFLLTKTNFKHWKKIYKTIIIGLVFGGLCILSTEFGPKYQGIPLNARTAAVVTASFVFGWPAGLIAGGIGALERGLSILWLPDARSFTEVACTVSTAVAGIVAGLLRKFMFDDKTPSPIAGMLCAFVIEVFHMLMVFLTNFAEITKALTVIQNVTAPMVLSNSLAVFLSLLVEGLLLYFYGMEERLFRTSKKKIATSVQINLIFVVVGCFIASMLLTYFIEDTTVKKTSENTINENISDIVRQVNDYSDSKIIEKSDFIASEIDRSNIAGINPETADIPATWEEQATLNNKCAYWASIYNVTEVHLANSDGVIYATNVKGDYKFDLKSTEQSMYFHETLNQTKNGYYHVAQPFGKIGISTEENPIYRKYGGTRIGGDDFQYTQGFVQVGYSEIEYFAEINKVIKDSTYYRRVGTEGRIMIATFNMEIVSDRDGTYTGKKLNAPEVWGESFKGDNLNALTLSKLGTVPTYYICENVEGYYIVGTMTENEVRTQLSMTLYVTGFIEVIVYALLVILAYAFIDNVIVKRINKVNGELNEITSGNLDVVVDVTSHQEFQTLSEDINHTVDRLKEYIDEANKRIDRELEFAKQIQMSSLPAPLEVKPTLDLYAMMMTAKEVGGDFYDFYYLDNDHMVILIADVSGKGIPAAMFMMKSKTLIKSFVLRGMKPNDAFFAANNELCHENEAEMFVTAWMGIINIKTGDVEFCNAGHNAPLLGTQSKHDFHYFKTKANLVLGGMENVPYTLGTYKLSDGETIFLYTDGVTEATNSNNELFSEQRLQDHLNMADGLTNRMIIKSLKICVDEFQGDNQFDDITMLAFTYLGKTEKYTLNIKSNPEEFDKLYDFVDKTLSGKVQDTKKKHVLVSLDEVLSNIANYGYKDEPGPINLVITIEEDRVVVMIADAAPKFNPLEEQDPDTTLDAEDRKIGGLGIFMVKKLMDEVHYMYEFGRNLITLIIKR